MNGGTFPNYSIFSHFRALSSCAQAVFHEPNVLPLVASDHTLAPGYGATQGALLQPILPSHIWHMLLSAMGKSYCLFVLKVEPNLGHTQNYVTQISGPPKKILEFAFPLMYLVRSFQNIFAYQTLYKPSLLYISRRGHPSWRPACNLHTALHLMAL